MIIVLYAESRLLMEPPFPGMDPYLEMPSMWPDVQSSISMSIANQLQTLFDDRYFTAIVPYEAQETISFFHRQSGEYRSCSATTRYVRIEVRVVGERTVVTALVVLAPCNKRPPLNGAAIYAKFQHDTFESGVNLLEIDLLRGGRRPQVARTLPAAPHFVFLSRVQRRPMIEIWPLALDQPIPRIPVPLRYPDRDVPLDLGAAIHEAYRRARYDLDLDYREPPPAPALAPAESAWLNTHLHERGLR